MDQNKLFNNLKVWMTTAEAAEYLGITVASLRSKINRGQVKIDGKLGRLHRFRRESLDNLLESFKPKRGFYD